MCFQAGPSLYCKAGNERERGKKQKSVRKHHKAQTCVSRTSTATKEKKRKTKRLLYLRNRKIRAGKVHHSLKSAEVLGSLAYLQSELRCRATSTPRDVDPGGLQLPHTIHSFVQVLYALGGLGRKILKGKEDFLLLLCLFNLVDDLHLSMVDQPFQTSEQMLTVTMDDDNRAFYI